MKETRTICDVCRTETSEGLPARLAWADGVSQPKSVLGVAMFTDVHDICPSCLARAQAALRPRERPSPRRKAKEGAGDG